MFNLKKVIEYLFYLFVFLLPWQTRLIHHQGIINGGNWEYGTFSLYATELLLGVIFLLIIILALKQIRIAGIKTKIQKLDILLILFFVFCSLSIIWSINAFLSWQYLVVLMEALALLYLASRIGWNFTKLAVAFSASAFMQACIAIYQFSTQTVIGNKWLGMASQFVEDGGVSVIEGSGRWLRAYGSLSHPNMLGGFLVVGLLFLIGLLFDYQRKYYNPPWRINYKLVLSALCLFSSLVIITYGLLLSFSRSAWLGLIIAILFIWIVLFWQKQKRLLWFFLKINIVILMVVALFVANYGNLLFSRFDTSSRLEAQSITERQVGWQESLDIIQSNPLLGVGLGTYTVSLYDLDSSQSSYYYQPVHNVDLLVMSELGIIGWLLLTITIIYLLYLIFRKYGREMNTETLLILASFIVLLIIGIFDHYLWSLYFGLMFSFLIIGLLVNKINYKI